MYLELETGLMIKKSLIDMVNVETNADSIELQLHGDRLDRSIFVEGEDYYSVHVCYFKNQTDETDAVDFRCHFLKCILQAVRKILIEDQYKCLSDITHQDFYNSDERLVPWAKKYELAFALDTRKTEESWKEEEPNNNKEGE